MRTKVSLTADMQTEDGPFMASGHGCSVVSPGFVNGDDKLAVNGGDTSLDSSEPCCVNWQEEVRRGGSLRQVDLDAGVNGWASPPGPSFQVRSSNYLIKHQKCASEECLFETVGVDWLRSHHKLDHVLSRPDNRVIQALRRCHDHDQGLEDFILAVNLQIPGRDYHHAVFYFVSSDPIPSGSLLYRFIYEEDDDFRNSRFKLISRIVKGPWIVRATVANHAACLLGKALVCNYYNGPNYFEIDVDVSTSVLANAILHLALGYVSSVTVDMAFLVEAQTEEELPERILGAVRIAQIEMASASLIEQAAGAMRSVSLGPQVALHESSWKKLSKSFSFLGHGSKAFKGKETDAG
ncbi:hypothetical protein KP509_07G074600 [Ceratopteris richardii]|uniref:Protein ENHANCED DISEASE RESISTANCE 2 C-terminal domain-containing protein n=1 Tax=Ceratopteris richardii TaxID=49495 RepID=A0A8T2UFW4_CERRI|nr:hypothetical protein KP509_07G074600 [Ceratopteris richardii]